MNPLLQGGPAWYSPGVRTSTFEASLTAFRRMADADVADLCYDAVNGQLSAAARDALLLECARRLTHQQEVP